MNPVLEQLNLVPMDDKGAFHQAESVMGVLDIPATQAQQDALDIAQGDWKTAQDSLAAAKKAFGG